MRLTKADQCRFMLMALGVEFVRVTAAQGFWRTSRYADCYRWEFSGVYKGVSIYGGCWETMTECVKARALQLDVKSGEVWPVSQKNDTYAPPANGGERGWR